MPLQKIVETLVPTATKEEVPKLFREPHVETGFRHLHQPWRYYILSLFQIHNECMNVWTHVIALLMTMARVAIFAREFDLIYDKFMWPFTACLLSMLVLYMCSSFAHCFQNKSELVHYTCFMIDYAGIGLYGLGSVIIHHAYCLHPNMIASFVHSYSIPVGVILAILVCICCSISKTFYSRPYPYTRRLWQVISVVAVYIWLILPVWHRVHLYLTDQVPWDSGMGHHIQQMMWFVAGGFFFGSDIPQRFFPGKFDFLGHSHQLFHICIMMTSYKQLDAVYHDLKNLRNEPLVKLHPSPTFYNTFGVIFLVIFVNILSTLFFREVAKFKIAKESKCS
ncbi:membrane progestin receptor beta-like [Gigantopelta aegis]|uniref:membrane progestin receptor beta-like n=1 Tax=Gigantopelta aegis TaxID=1735272 RepID=UPI001B88C48F|nr:membrane progestin receptor beta-like [Gigantopelta aegis]